MTFQTLGYSGGSGLRGENSLAPIRLCSPPLCLVLSVMQVSPGAFLTEPPPGWAWVGKVLSSSNGHGRWEQLGLRLAQVGRFTAPRPQ